MTDVATHDQWRAWAITGGPHTKLVVEGIFSHGGPGVVVLLNEAVPQGVNKKILLLEVKLHALPGVWPKIIQPVPASYVKSPYHANQYDGVQIRYPGNTIVSVDAVVDTGNGPA
jgi:hypothetical protein